MNRPVIRAALPLIYFVCLTAIAGAADPTPDEKLPRPRAIPEANTPGVVYPLYYRTSRYDVWQMYAPDRSGYFRPRVIYSPNGPYWAHNGAPYLYAETHQGWFSSSVSGTPYRAAPAVMPYCDD